MTTMAALLGGLPLALGHGEGPELRRPLGIAIVGGLVLQPGADALHDAGGVSVPGSPALALGGAAQSQSPPSAGAPVTGVKVAKDRLLATLLSEPRPSGSGHSDESPLLQIALCLPRRDRRDPCFQSRDRQGVVIPMSLRFFKSPPASVAAITFGAGNQAGPGGLVRFVNPDRFHIRWLAVRELLKMPRTLPVKQRTRFRRCRRIVPMELEVDKVSIV